MNSLFTSPHEYWPVFSQGLALGLGLIVAIGAQNAFVLRQGWRKEHVGAVILFCCITDAAFIAAGVLGMAKILGERPVFALILALAGCFFLLWYGWKALLRMRQVNQLHAEQDDRTLGRAAVLANAAAFTLLNPHVYLDTVLLVGSVGAQHTRSLQIWFVLGASTASILWFSLLGLGARRLAPWFAKPKAWQILDGLIGVTMWSLAALLVRHLWSTL